MKRREKPKKGGNRIIFFLNAQLPKEKKTIEEKVSRSNYKKPSMQCKSTTLTHNLQAMDKFNFIRDGASSLPPGFRFQPTDQEIVFQYLARKIFSSPLPASVIPELDVFAFHPSNLPGDTERDRYFFARRELDLRSNGGRGCGGFWKVSGLDKRIVCSKRTPIVGIRRTLVFYQGKHLRAVRTDWFVHVYCIVLSENIGCNIHHKRLSQGAQKQIGKWVLCHVFMKRCLKDDGLQQRCDHFEMSDADSCLSSSSASSSDLSVLSEVSSTTVDSETTP